MTRNILITGAAGFIGAAISKRLLNRGENVIGIDDLNDYYDVNLKKSRLKRIYETAAKATGNWSFFDFSIENKDKLDELTDLFSPNIVINLAAQAGVRYSIENPDKYLKTNLLGFGNMLEFCKNNRVENFIYASSSSVYGGNKNLPFKESHSVDHPINFYAASKKANEVMAHSYSHLFQIPTIGLRFFTVYGPWGRPDMAPMIFAKSIIQKVPIKVFNYGEMFRDYTYIDDVVDAIEGCCYKPAIKNKSFNFLDPNPSSSFAPHMIFNVGSNKPISLLKFIEKLEKEFEISSIKDFKPMQPGDIEKTWANIDNLNSWIGYNPKINFDKGIHNFATWYKSYFHFH